MTNPYAAPDAELNGPTSGGDETYEPTFFALNGRIGRVRYLAYSTCMYFLMSMVVTVLLLLYMRNKSSFAGGSAMFLVLLYVPTIAVMLAIMRRRLHDLDHSGWMGLLMLVPILNAFFGLYLLFAAGTQGANRYGSMPSKNSTAAILGALIFPLLVAIGIVASIALPAYQSHVMKAKAAAAHQAP